MDINENTGEIISHSKTRQNYLLSIFVTLVFPLTSVLIEISIKGIDHIEAETFFLASSIYSIGVAFRSEKQLTLVIGIWTSISCAAFYGTLLGNSDYELSFLQISYIVIPMGYFIVQYLIERYERHVVKKETFLTFN